jgi:hypothetical protein
VRCLGSLTVTIGLYASLEGICRRAGTWWGAAGLLLNLPFAILFVWEKALGLLAAAVGVLAIALWARWRWRSSQAALAQWRGRRDEALRMEMAELRERAWDR